MIEGEELKEMFSEFGALGYQIEKIALVLSVPDEEAESLLNEHQRSYDSGIAKLRFQLDRKLMQMALSGDLKALRELEKQQRKNNAG